MRTLSCEAAAVALDSGARTARRPTVLETPSLTHSGPGFGGFAAAESFPVVNLAGLAAALDVLATAFDAAGLAGSFARLPLADLTVLAAASSTSASAARRAAFAFVSAFADFALSSAAFVAVALAAASVVLSTAARGGSTASRQEGSRSRLAVAGSRLTGRTAARLGATGRLLVTALVPLFVPPFIAAFLGPVFTAGDAERAVEALRRFVHFAMSPEGDLRQKSTLKSRCKALKGSHGDSPVVQHHIRGSDQVGSHGFCCPLRPGRWKMPLGVATVDCISA